MNRAAQRSAPPHQGGCSTKHQFYPDTRKRRGNPLPFAAVYVDLGDVHKKARRKIVEQEPHLMGPSAIMLAGQAVRCLVEKSQATEQEPEFHQVANTFFRKVVITESVRSDLAPALEKYVGRKSKESKRQEGEPAAVNELGFFMEASQILVRIPMGDNEHGQVTHLGFALRSFVTLLCSLSRAAYVGFLRRPVPDVFQSTGKLLYVVGGVLDTQVLIGVICNFPIRPLAIEQLGQFPLEGSKAIKLVVPGDDGVNHALPFLQVLARDDVGMKPRISPLR